MRHGRGIGSKRRVQYVNGSHTERLEHVAIMECIKSGAVGVEGTGDGGGRCNGGGRASFAAKLVLSALGQLKIQVHYNQLPELPL